MVAHEARRIEKSTCVRAVLRQWFTVHFWNLEQPSAEKAGINPTYQAPFQEVVTSPLPSPLGVEQNFVLCGNPVYGDEKEMKENTCTRRLVLHTPLCAPGALWPARSSSEDKIAAAVHALRPYPLMLAKRGAATVLAP